MVTATFLRIKEKLLQLSTDDSDYSQWLSARNINCKKYLLHTEIRGVCRLRIPKIPLLLRRITDRRSDDKAMS